MVAQWLAPFNSWDKLEQTPVTFSSGTSEYRKSINEWIIYNNKSSYISIYVLYKTYNNLLTPLFCQILFFDWSIANIHPRLSVRDLYFSRRAAAHKGDKAQKETTRIHLVNSLFLVQISMQLRKSNQWSERMLLPHIGGSGRGVGQRAIFGLSTLVCTVAKQLHWDLTPM